VSDVAEGGPEASAELARTLLAVIPDVVAVVRRDGLIETLRLPTAMKIPPSLSWEGFRITDTMDAADARRWQEMIETCIASGSEQNGLYELEAFGQHMSWDVRLVPYGEDRVLALARDVTSRVALERENRAAADLLGRVTSRLPLCVYLYDLERRHTRHLNRSVAEHLGYSGADSESIDRDPMDALVHPDDRSALARLLESAAAATDGEVVSAELRMRAAGDEWRNFRASFQVFHRGAGGAPTALLGVLEDVTRRLRERDRAGQAAKMEAVGQLAASVAHEYNNLLTGMSLALSLLLESSRPGDPGHRDLQDLASSVARASGLTKHLLSFSQSTSKRIDTLNLVALFGEALPYLQRLLGPRVAVSANLDPGPIWVRADPHELEQVLINLGVNARDAMPGGGTFTLGLSEEAGTARIDLQDSGPGIERGLRERVFEPFFTTRAGLGTGLGLTSVQRIITGYGGAVHIVDSASGAHFEIRLPTCAAPEDGEQTQHAAQRIVLLVEDEPSLRRLIADLLRREGLQVEAAADCDEARALLAEGLEPHLVLCDLMLPKVRGTEVVREIRSQLPGVKALFLSGFAGEPGLEDPLLAKPFTPTQLIDAVEGLLGKE